MPGCAVATCKNTNRNTKETGIKYFGFPKSEDLAKQWIGVCRRKDKINLKYARVCSIHFDEASFEYPLQQKLLNYFPKNSRNLKADAIPVLHLPGSLQKPKNTERLNRIYKRRQRRVVEEILKESSHCMVPQLSTSKNEYQFPMSNIETILVEVQGTTVNEKNSDEKKEQEINKLMKKIKMLEEQNDALLKNIEVVKDSISKKYEDALATVFTPGQIRKLMDPVKDKKIWWSSEDIASAIALRSVSPKAYRYLRTNSYPLPAISTLRRWVLSFNINQGILKNVILLMKKKSTDLIETDRVCVLSFDEIRISNKIDFDKKREQIVGPHKTCQAVMVRGIFSNWKQPVYYHFDQPMTKHILEEIISELFKANFIVVAISSDMGSGNIALRSELNIGHDKNCSFSHPCDGSLQIFVYGDVRHLIKLARNHLLDKGFIVDTTLGHKLTKHLNLEESMLQRVSPVLSNTVGKENGLMPGNSNWKEVQLFNDWFDLFNSGSKFVGNCPLKSAFGTDLQNQKNVINQMSEFIVGKQEAMIPFQKDILLSNRSLIKMYEYLSQKYKIYYILTSSLNRDILENFFTYIRGMSGANDHPSPMDFTHRLRCYILGKNSTENANTVKEESHVLDKTGLPTWESDTEEFCLTQEMLSSLVREDQNEVF